MSTWFLSQNWPNDVIISVTSHVILNVLTNRIYVIALLTRIQGRLCDKNSVCLSPKIENWEYLSNIKEKWNACQGGTFGPRHGRPGCNRHFVVNKVHLGPRRNENPTRSLMQSEPFSVWCNQITWQEAIKVPMIGYVYSWLHTYFLLVCFYMPVKKLTLLCLNKKQREWYQNTKNHLILFHINVIQDGY